jgi:predicted transcriptional regulator of viral defense system
MSRGLNFGPMNETNVPRLPRGRAQLRQVLAASGDVIHISDATKALAVSRTEAAKRLARWREQGWLRRVGSGAYVPASIDTLGSERVLDDAWVLVPALFAPAYIAGRTAAEHWDLTEQIFKDIVVVTGQTVRKRHQKRQGFDFTLKHLKPEKIFGAKLSGVTTPRCRSPTFTERLSTCSTTSRSAAAFSRFRIA